MTIAFCATQVKDLMTPHPELISPQATLQQAAKRMASVKCGALPVGTEHKLQGIITDRDIIIRAIARGKNPATEKIADYMTCPVFACNELDTLEAAAEKMHEHKISRLVVRNKEGRTVGVLSFGGILRNDANPHEIAGVVKHAGGPISV